MRTRSIPANWTPAAALTVMALAATVACSSGPAVEKTGDAAAAQAADTIYTGGDIVTVNDAQPTAEALAVKDGKILAVGARAEVEKAHKGDDDADRRPRRQDAAAELPRRAQPLHQLAARRQPVQALRAALRPGQGRREHRRRAQEVRRGAQDPEGRDDHGLRLRRHRHAGRPASQPRRPRRGVPGQPGAGRPRVDARRGDEQPRPEEVRLQRRHQDAAGRRHRAQAGHQRALRPDHGDRVPAGDGAGGADDAGAGDRVDARRARCSTRKPASPPPTRERPTWRSCRR